MIPFSGSQNGSEYREHSKYILIKPGKQKAVPRKAVGGHISYNEIHVLI